MGQPLNKLTNMLFYSLGCSKLLVLNSVCGMGHTYAADVG